MPVIFSSHQLDLVERLCDRVGIISSGRMQALGTIDELRTTDRPDWSLTVDDPDAVVAALTAGGITARAEGRTVRVDTADDQAALGIALGTGPVHEFTRIRPSLTDLFRDVVSADEPAVEPAPSTPRRGLFGRRRSA